MRAMNFSVEIAGATVALDLLNFRGGHHTGHHVRRDPAHGPGWFVFGRNAAYGGDYIMRTARPDRPYRHHRGYNGRVARGWRTRAEAQAVADWLNAKDADCLGLIMQLPLEGTVFREELPRGWAVVDTSLGEPV